MTCVLIVQEIGWSDLVYTGIVEYIDVNEEETTMIAMFVLLPALLQPVSLITFPSLPS